MTDPAAQLQHLLASLESIFGELPPRLLHELQTGGDVDAVIADLHAAAYLQGWNAAKSEPPRE